MTDTKGNAKSVGTWATPKKRASRAAQFIPFAALHGYYDLVREQERHVEPRKEITEEEALRLSRILCRVKKGDMMRVVHYQGNAYVTTIGVVTEVVIPYRTITLVTTKINFDDIMDIEFV